MDWDTNAEEALGKVPFFVRKRVRKRVEEEASRVGADRVTIRHLNTCRQRFMDNQQSEVHGFQVEGCFGESACPNRIELGPALIPRLEALLTGFDLKRFMAERVKGPLKMHHEFRLTIADCPNACSRPQIVDIGLIAALRPRLSEEPCSGCGACVAACREGAIQLAEGSAPPQIDGTRCLGCGQCIKDCPSGSIVEGDKGFRILLGGKLGRHPQLGHELDRLFSQEESLAVIGRCLSHFKAENRNGERFGEILNRSGLGFLDLHAG